MISLSVFSPMGLRFGMRFATSLAALIVAGCAQGDPVGGSSSSSGTPSTSAGGGTDAGSGGATTTGDVTTSTSVGGPGSTATSSSGPGGGDGGGTSGPGGGDGPSGPGGGDGASGPGTGGGAGVGGSGGDAPAPVCGDEAIDDGEDCDGDDLGAATCANIGQGFIGGTLSCDACAFDTAGCMAPPDCGNDFIEGTEACDGPDLAGATCASRGWGSGTLSCTAGCTLDESDCQTCGDAAVTGDEICDGANLDGASCVSLLHDGGSLTCAGDCAAFVETACTDCGDGVREGAEACDGSQFGSATCVNSGGGFSGGTLSCSASCAITTGNCWTCGDGVVQAGQVCPVCSDDTDNDTDGYRDLADLGCTNGSDTDEQLYLSSCAGGTAGPIYDISYADTSTDFFITFSNAGYPDTINAPCESNTGPEVVWVYRAAAAESDIIFRTDLGPTAIDTVLTVRRDSCSNASGAVCNDDFNGLQSLVQVINVEAGELLFITIESYGSATGEFTLDVDLASNG